MSHHGFDEEAERRMREVMKDIFGEFPNGRLNPQDQGAMAVSIGQENGAVVLRFPRNLNWIGFTPDQAIDIAETLVKHARACGSKKPLCALAAEAERRGMLKAAGICREQKQLWKLGQVSSPIADFDTCAAAIERAAKGEG